MTAAKSDAKSDGVGLCSGLVAPNPRVADVVSAQSPTAEAVVQCLGMLIAMQEALLPLRVPAEIPI